MELEADGGFKGCCILSRSYFSKCDVPPLQVAPVCFPRKRVMGFYPDLVLELFVLTNQSLLMQKVGYEGVGNLQTIGPARRRH